MSTFTCFSTNGKGLDQLKKEKRKRAILDSSEVRIQVRAVSLNYRDSLVLNGAYNKKDQVPFIPCSDMAGEVIECGSAVKKWKKGDRVMNHPMRFWPAGNINSAWIRTCVGAAGLDGTLSEEICFPEHALVKIPEHLSYDEASCFPCAGLTAWSALVEFAQVKPGEATLIQGTGGVSLFAAQIASAMGSEIYLSSSQSEKLAQVSDSFKVSGTVNYQDEDWPRQLRNLKSDGMDVVVEVAGGDSLAQSISATNYGARIAVIGVLNGRESSFPIYDLMARQIHMKGIYIGSAQGLEKCMNFYESAKLRPHISKTFSFDQSPDAFKFMMDQKHMGKVVITTTC